jgi:regulator of RNase E activity RraA
MKLIHCADLHLDSPLEANLTGARARERARELRESFFCALLSDVMDNLGYAKQALPPRIRPLDEDLVMVGRARTMLYADTSYAPSNALYRAVGFTEAGRLIGFDFV